MLMTKSFKNIHLIKWDIHTVLKTHDKILDILSNRVNNQKVHIETIYTESGIQVVQKLTNDTYNISKNSLPLLSDREAKFSKDAMDMIVNNFMNSYNLKTQDEYNKYKEILLNNGNNEVTVVIDTSNIVLQTNHISDEEIDRAKKHLISNHDFYESKKLCDVCGKRSNNISDKNRFGIGKSYYYCDDHRVKELYRNKSIINNQILSYNGKNKINLGSKPTCDVCKGSLFTSIYTDQFYLLYDDTKVCNNCVIHGYIEKNLLNQHGHRCENCRGQGYIRDYKLYKVDCAYCQGTGWIKKENSK
ncbi:DNA-binding domain-containing protein [Bacillus phage PBS1]|uniref:DNA-binding domain-containing protein n=1 Tax=Bacillus phage PBS1 TaxID=2884423 RepID=A0A223LCD8_BPPB1|nr:DNA binding protein [Bacillus phage PBS1]ASU00050.1 DNA-binding domain-containing protein [Bacillus phage PBS1]BDE75437.1 hypothetical protein [Bacillus phage PBS1]